MGLFSKKPEQREQPKLRRKEVLGFVAAAMREADANPDGDDFLREQARRNKAAEKLTQAEIKAGHEALRRNGY
jgi:hypothetical protein